MTDTMIFLSYTSDDLAETEKLRQALADRGFRPWMEAKDILPGEQRDVVVDKAIRTADFILICISTISVGARGLLQRQIKQALDLWQEKRVDDIFVIPVRLDDCRLPDELTPYAPADLFADEGWERLVAALEAGMAKRGQAPAPPRPAIKLPAALPSRPAPADQGGPASQAPPIIDRHEAIRRFRELMRPGSPWRVMRLLGDAKMGKTHLLGQVFPRVARDEFAARLAVLSLRNQTQSVAELLEAARRPLGSALQFPRFSDAYQAWLDTPGPESRDLATVLAQAGQAAREGGGPASLERRLTAQFVADLGQLSDRTAVLLIDAVNESTPGVQKWLAEALVPELFSLDHVRVVLAGRTVPEPSISVAAFCHSYQLEPVTDEMAYIEYCRQVDVALAEQSVRDFARAARYEPGSFVDLLAAFRPAGVSHA